MLLNENEWCQAMMGSDSKKTFKEYLYDSYMCGDSVKDIAESINKSKSTVYKYLEEMKNKIRYPILKAQIKSVLIQGDFKFFIENLNYSDICLIRRKFNLSGYDKETKIKAILEYFKNFSVLGLYPEELTKLKIKLAFRKRAKETHPDSNKNVDKYGKEFQEVYNAYSVLVQVYN